MGSHDNVEAGIIPRLCNALFERIALDKNNMACQVNWWYLLSICFPLSFQNGIHQIFIEPLHNFKWLAIFFGTNINFEGNITIFSFLGQGWSVLHGDL